LQDTLNSNNFRALIATHKEASNIYLRYGSHSGGVNSE
jgi:hypothetical protein